MIRLTSILLKIIVIWLTRNVYLLNIQVTPDDTSVIHNVHNKPYDTMTHFDLFID